MKKIKSVILFLLLVPMFTFLSSGQHAAAQVFEDSANNVAQLEFDADCEVTPGTQLDAQNCGIIAYVVLAINILSAVAGLAITASIMIAGYQYMTARDNAGQIEAARKRIVWAITALLLFIFMYAGLNFIVPGGVL